MPHIKIIAGFVFTVIFSFSVDAQPPFDYIYNNRDDNFIDNADSGIRPFFWNNGVLYLGFCYDTDESRWGLSLIFYDTLGYFNWRRKLFLPGYSIFQGNDIVFFNNYSFYVCGVALQSNFYKLDCFITKHSIEGDTMLCKILNEPLAKYPEDVLKYGDDEFLMLSWMSNSISNDTNRIVIDRLDTNLNILQTYTSEPSLKLPKKIIKTPHDSFFVGGTMQNYPGGNLKIFTEIFDLDLNHLSSEYYTLGVNEIFKSYVIFQDKVFLNYEVLNHIPMPRWVCKVGRMNQYAHIFGNLYLGYYTINIDMNNLININDSLLATIVDNIYPEQYYLYFIDYNLTKVCSSYVSMPNISSEFLFPADIASIPGNRIAGTGYFFDNPNTNNDSQDHWDYLIDDVYSFIDQNCNNQTNVNEYSTLCNSNTSFFSVFPTVTDKFLEVEPRKPVLYQVQIYTVNGILISTYSSIEKIQLNISFLNKGIYILKVLSSGYYHSFKIIKI